MPRRFDWLFKELFLILSAPIFWAVLTNFGRVWRFIDDRYYHKKAKQWRQDKKEAKRLHKELIGHYDFYNFQLFGTTENCCHDVVAKLCSSCRRRRKKRRKATRWCTCCFKRDRDYKKYSKRTKSNKKEIVNSQELTKSSSDDMVNDDAFTGIYLNNINKMYDAKEDDNIAVKDDDNKNNFREGKLKNVATKQEDLKTSMSKDNAVSKSNNEADEKEGLESSTLTSESAISKSNNEADEKEGLESSTLTSESAIDSITTESSQTNIFKTPLRKGLPSISIDTSPLDSSESHKEDKRWQTIGKHAVLRSKLAPVTPHTFKSDAEVTHNVMYSRSFVNQEEDY